jgi:hypothetical protein
VNANGEWNATWAEGQPSAARQLTRELPTIARSVGTNIYLVRDAGNFVRATMTEGKVQLAIDLVYESNPDLEPPPPPIEGVVIESLTDLRANKLTCILSRSEPRDLVDLLFLDRAGFHPEQDLRHAMAKDAGIDPGVLAWLLSQFPTAPLPNMLLPLTSEELKSFRNDLAERFRKLTLP